MDILGKGAGLVLAAALLSACQVTVEQPTAATPTRTVLGGTKSLATPPSSVTPPAAPIGGSIDFGNDSGPFPFDGECDDPRFVGIGVAADTILDSANQFRDASDCRAMFSSGQASLRPGGGAGFPRGGGTAINFGSDSGTFPFDGECDDPRFRGPGMAAATTLSPVNQFGDATDCQNLFNAGMVFL